MTTDQLAETRPGTMQVSLLGGPAAWLGHFLGCYVIAEFGCLAGLGQVHAAGITVVAWALLGHSAVMFAAAALATAVAWRLGRQERRVAGGGPASREDSAPGFVARHGGLTNGVFTVIIAVQTVPVFYFWRGC